MGDTFPTGNVIEDPDQLWCVECCEKIANEKCFQTVSQVISFLCNEEHEQLNTIIINAITKPKKKKTQQPPKTSMSSNILHSSKNYRKDWVSQFGLYRYESAAVLPGRMHSSERKKLTMRVALVLGSTFFVAILIFYMAIYMGTYSDADRMIMLSKLEEYDLPNRINPALSSSSPPPPPPPLTTVFYPDDQISAYHHIFASTTPLSTKISKKRMSTNKSINNAVANTITHPSNHRLHYSKLSRNHDFATDMMGLTVKPTITAIKHREFPQQRMFLPTFDDYDNDVVDVSYPKANNIQDILNQSSDDDEIGSVGGGDMINDQILPSMPFSRTMKVEGVYRREKMKRDQLSTMETSVQTQAPMRSPHNKSVQHKFDPFLKFKPSSPRDVNLLAASNVMKIKSFTHSKPRPLTTPLDNTDPNVVYHQVLSANRNGRLDKTAQINHKPFSLMLDVYPMLDDELSTRQTPFGVAPHRRPFYPVNSHAINNNLPYNKDSTVHNPFQYPQLQPYPYNRSPYALNPTAKEGYIRNYAMQRMNTQRSLSSAPSSRRSITSYSDEMPSQITVHLNLYPDRKKTRNIGIVHRDAMATVDHDLSTTIAPISSTDNDHAHTLWRRLERPINNTITKLIDSMRSGQLKFLKSPLIPPFSQIKIDPFHELVDMTGSSSTHVPIKQFTTVFTTDKPTDFNPTTFDSKKLLPNLSFRKSQKINRNSKHPLDNSITSTTQSSSENGLQSSMPISTLASTLSNQLASTMSSSTTVTATATSSPIYITPINQIPFGFGTTIPTQFQTATTTTTTMPMIRNTADYSNESKLDQTTTAAYGII